MRCPSNSLVVVENSRSLGCEKASITFHAPATSRRIVRILTPLLALSQGSLAAIVFYFVFCAGVLKGPLFPEFAANANPFGSCTQPALRPMHQEFPSVADGAKLLIWWLVVGFAERLVPDLLTCLRDQANQTQGGSQKAEAE